MTDPVFHCLLALRSPYITMQDTCMRQTISPEQRLFATLRELGDGEKSPGPQVHDWDLPQALGIIIPETCSDIIQVLQKDYILVSLPWFRSISISTRPNYHETSHTISKN
ncbi:uncharacterized protein LOC143998299 [Lithobates pipiens]